MHVNFNQPFLGAATCGLLLLGTTVFTPGVRAQGTVNFANTAASLITLSDGTPLPIGTYTVGLIYWQNDPALNFGWGNSSIAGLNTIKTSANFITPGRFIGGTATTPNTTAGGVNAFFAVVAWKTSFGSYDAAQAAGGMDNYGFSSIFLNGTGNPNAVPPGAPAPMSGFTGFSFTFIPEPSIPALTALGAAGLLLNRRLRSPALSGRADRRTLGP